MRFTYGYDPAGRLTNLTLPNGDTQLRGLNPNGLPETVANTISATTTTWTLDWDPDGDIDQLAALSQGSATTDLVSTTGTPRGVASKGADHTVLASDIHGSNINSTGAGVPRANSYNAYGAPTGTDTLSPKLGYRGELTLGPLLNLRARDYQPTTGAFTTTDPINGVPGTTTLNNPYHYTNNNPLNLVDPTGLRPDDTTTGCESALIPIVCEYHDEIITTAAIVLSLAVGAIAGPVILAAYGPILGGAISGALGGMVFSIADQLGRTGRIDTDRLLFDTSLGAVGGAAGGALAELLAPAAKAMSFGRARTPWSSPIANDASAAAAQSSDDAARAATRAPGGGGHLTDPNPSPYQVHIDPRTGRGPMGIDTSGYKGPATANGGVRNSRAFWDDWAEAYPDTLSPTNQARVSGPRPRSPQVDDQWVQHFPETAGNRGETLVHHHLDCGPTAIALPQSVHGNTPGFGIWHAGC